MCFRKHDGAIFSLLSTVAPLKQTQRICVIFIIPVHRARVKLQKTSKLIQA